jgi:hypothetical protein
VRLQFDPAVPWSDVLDTLDLAVLAVETLYGTDRVSLEARHEVDDAVRRMSIDITTTVGRTLAILVLGFARRQYGDRAVEVVRAGGLFNDRFHLHRLCVQPPKTSTTNR